MSKIMLQMVSLCFKDVESFIFNFPSITSPFSNFVNVILGNNIPLPTECQDVQAMQALQIKASKVRGTFEFI